MSSSRWRNRHGGSSYGWVALWVGNVLKIRAHSCGPSGATLGALAGIRAVEIVA